MQDMKLSNGNKTSDCVYILCLKVNSIFLKINSKSRKRIPMPIIGRVTLVVHGEMVSRALFVMGD